jgi:hypothetical protein
MPPCYGIAMIRAVPSLAVASILLSACATKVDYPSLARRDAERITGTVQPVPSEPAPPAPLPPPNAEISARLSQLVQQARAADGRFSEERGRAERLVGQASGMGSESWAVASVALAELESARSDAMIAMAGIDEIHAADAVAHYNTPSGDAPEIATARDQVAGMIEEQDRTLAALSRRLAS